MQSYLAIYIYCQYHLKVYWVIYHWSFQLPSGVQVQAAMMCMFTIAPRDCTLVLLYYFATMHNNHVLIGTEPASHSGEIVKTLDTEIEELDLIYLARYFDCIDLFLDQLGLTGGEKDDVRGKKTTQLAMREALSLWRKRDPSKATFRQLTNITEEQRRGDIARKIEQYVSQFN